MKFVILGLAFGLSACAGTATTAPSVSVGLLGTYDAGVAGEVAYLGSGKSTPAEATKLRGLRVVASQDVQAVVAAETAGGNISALAATAQSAVNAFVSEANIVAPVVPVAVKGN